MGLRGRLKTALIVGKSSKKKKKGGAGGDTNEGTASASGAKVSSMMK